MLSFFSSPNYFSTWSWTQLQPRNRRCTIVNTSISNMKPHYMKRNHALHGKNELLRRGPDWTQRRRGQGRLPLELLSLLTHGTSCIWLSFKSNFPRRLVLRFVLVGANKHAQVGGSTINEKWIFRFFGFWLSIFSSGKGKKWSPENGTRELSDFLDS